MPSVDIVLPTSPATIPAPPVHWSTSPEQSVATPADATQDDDDGPPPITSTEAVAFRGMRFRGHAVPVVSDEDVVSFMKAATSSSQTTGTACPRNRMPLNTTASVDVMGGGPSSSS